MKHLKYYMSMIAGLLAMLTACTNDMVENGPSELWEKQGNEYTITTYVGIPSYEENQTITRSQTYGNEGIDRAEDIQLFCFDKDGFFLGLAKDLTLETTPKGDILENGSSNPKGIKATIPNSTARIHFVANATLDITQSPKWIGMHENMLMTSFESSAGEDQSQKIVYWGYVKKNTPEEMKAFLNGGADKPVIHLIRDRAKVKVELEDEVANEIEKVIVSIYDGQEHGTIAPFKTDLTFPDTHEMAVWNPDYITPTKDQKTYQGSEGQMENIAYTFENRNDASKPLKVILWATYKNGTHKRFLVLLQDKDNQLYRIKRNHIYKIKVKKLDASLGYDSFDAAVNGTPANNPWIVVEDIVPEVSDGKYTLSITNGTYILLNEGATAAQSISFKYVGDTDITANDFEAIWMKNTNCAINETPVITFNNGKGSIHYTLSTIDNSMKEGIIRLLDKKHGLSRNIHIYTIKNMEYEFEFPATMGKGISATAQLKFKIPANYPKELLPIEIKIASNDINPQNCGIEVGSTAEVDGGKEWNNWFVVKYESASVVGTTQTITIKNMRVNKSGTQGKFYVKASYYNGGYINAANVKTKAKEITFTYR